MQIKSIVQPITSINRIRKEFPKRYNCLSRINKKNGEITCVNEEKKGINITQSDCDKCLCAEVPRKFNKFVYGRKEI